MTSAMSMEMIHWQNEYGRGGPLPCLENG